MDDFDKMIADSLSDEDQAMIEELRHEDGFFKQAFGLFRGPTGWVNWTIIITQTVMFILGVWMAIRFFGAHDVASQLRWGIPAAVILLMGAMLKMSLIPVMQANRILQEIRRLELVLVDRLSR